jgi:hypothetical protein
LLDVVATHPMSSVWHSVFESIIAMEVRCFCNIYFLSKILMNDGYNKKAPQVMQGFRYDDFGLRTKSGNSMPRKVYNPYLD